MPNTKEVEQSAADFLRKKIGPENFWRFPQGFSQSEIFEYMEDFKALSPLEQSEKKEEWVKTEHRVPVEYRDKKVWVLDANNGTVYDSHLPNVSPEKLLEWFERNNLTHWRRYMPLPPKNLV